MDSRAIPVAARPPAPDVLARIRLSSLAQSARRPRSSTSAKQAASARTSPAGATAPRSSRPRARRARRRCVHTTGRPAQKQSSRRVRKAKRVSRVVGGGLDSAQSACISQAARSRVGDPALVEVHERVQQPELARRARAAARARGGRRMLRAPPMNTRRTVRAPLGEARHRADRGLGVQPAPDAAVPQHELAVRRRARRSPRAGRPRRTAAARARARRRARASITCAASGRGRRAPGPIRRSAEHRAEPQVALCLAGAHEVVARAQRGVQAVERRGRAHARRIQRAGGRRAARASRASRGSTGRTPRAPLSAAASDRPAATAGGPRRTSAAAISARSGAGACGRKGTVRTPSASPAHRGRRGRSSPTPCSLSARASSQQRIPSPAICSPTGSALMNSTRGAAEAVRGRVAGSRAGPRVRSGGASSIHPPPQRERVAEADAESTASAAGGAGAALAAPARQPARRPRSAARSREMARSPSTTTASVASVRGAVRPRSSP